MSISPKGLEEYIHKHIPITSSMGVHVCQASANKVCLQAPFNLNINHKRTVFGGSLHTVSTLAGWSLLFVNLKPVFEETEIVIASSEIQYLVPVTTNFMVQCSLPEEEVWTRFMTLLRRKSKARIKLTVEIYQQDKVAVHYCGTFVVFKK